MATLYPSQLNANNTPSAQDVVLVQADGEMEVKKSTLGEVVSNLSSEIKTAYELNNDTNAFTDAEKTKVDYLTITAPVDLDTAELTDTTYSPADPGTDGTDGTDGLLTDADKFKIDFISVTGAIDLDNVQELTSGVTASRPASPAIGFMYFDTELATGNGMPIWYNGSDWVDATGTLV